MLNPDHVATVLNGRSTDFPNNLTFMFDHDRSRMMTDKSNFFGTFFLQVQKIVLEIIYLRLCQLCGRRQYGSTSGVGPSRGAVEAVKYTFYFLSHLSSATTNAKAINAMMLEPFSPLLQCNMHHIVPVD